MLTLEQCKEVLDDSTLTDMEVEAIRDAIYSLSEQVIGKHYDTMDI